MRALGVLAALGLAAVAVWVIDPFDDGAAGEITAPDGPNVLVIVTDDQRDGQLRFMPRTRERIVSQGASFDNAFVTTPLCCPSRASIFSGKYAHNHGITGNVAISEGAVEAFDVEETWPEVLREAGYRTGLAGKYLNHWPIEQRPRIFDYYSWPDGAAARETGKRIDELRWDAAREFVSASEDDDRRPWALTLTLHAPHTPYEPPNRYEDLDPGPRPRNPATRERDLSDKAQSVRELQVRAPVLDESWAGQARTLRAADDLIGKLVRLLAETGERRKTLVIFTSDNGYMTGEHGLTKKVWPYLPSIGVPMVVSWPGHVAKGTTSDALVANIDIAPTVIEAAGLEADYPLDGRSMLSGPRRDWLLLEGPRLKPTSPFKAWDAYLDGRRHLIQWHDDEGWRELYDLQADPYEVESLLAGDDPANDAAAAELLESIEQASRCVGEECP